MQAQRLGATVALFLCAIHLVLSLDLHRLAHSRFVVEYRTLPPDSADQDSAGQQFASHTGSNRSQDDLIYLMMRHLAKHNISYWNMQLFDIAPQVFLGVSLTLESKQHAKYLKRASFVKEIYSVMPVARPVFADKPLIVDPSVHNPIDTFGAHAQVGISRLHDQGYQCRGIKVAVIDSGYDCKHPDLGGGFGKGFKVETGYDFVGDDYDGTNQLKPKDDPCSSCAYHGTHVMGVLAANKNKMGFSGVCPEATMASYRVFGCQEGTTDELIAAALLRAFRDGADVYSLSVGAPRGWQRGSIATVIASRIAQKRVVVASAGNAGQAGMFYSTAPATGRQVLSVGSVQAAAVVAYPFTTSALSSKTLYYYANLAMKPGNFGVCMIGKGDKKDDACGPLPHELPKLTDCVVLVRRSESPACRLTNQLANLLGRGAMQVLWINNNSVEQYAPFDVTRGLSVGIVSPEVGDYLIKSFHANPKGFRINLSMNTTAAQVPSSDHGQVSAFSNYGPMFDLSSPQPAVLGVGGNVLSTFPLSLGSYAVASGTSISAPQVAGIAALILQIRGRRIDPRYVLSQVVTSALPVPSSDRTGILESASHQGTGVVNAWCAAFSKTLVPTYSISLNDSTNFRGHHYLPIINHGNETVSYLLQHLPAGTAQTFTTQSSFPNEWPVPLTKDAAQVTFSESEFSLAPGEKKHVKVIFSPPQGLVSKNLPVYSGFIIFSTTTECESHTVSYYGVGAPLKGQAVLDTGTVNGENYHLPALISQKTNLPIGDGSSFTLLDQDAPAVEYRLTFGTPLLLFHLVPGDSVLPPPQGSVQKKANAPHRSAPHHPKSHSKPALIRRSAGEVDSLNSALYRRSQNTSALSKNHFLLEKSQSTPGSSSFPGRLPNLYKNITLLGSLTSYDVLDKWLPRHTKTESNLMPLGESIFDLSCKNYLNPPAIPVQSGTYRILFRALRVTGDTSIDDDFEAWLSPPFTLNRSKGQNTSLAPQSSIIPVKHNHSNSHS